MGVDNTNEDTMENQQEEKVKKPRKKRSATKKVKDPDPGELNINQAQTDTSEEETGTVKKKRSGAKKKKTTTTTSKKRSSKKIREVKAIALAEDDFNESGENSELELEPTGQAEVSKVKVEVLPKASAADVQSQLTLLKEPAAMNLQGAKVQTTGSQTINARDLKQ